MSDLRWYQTLFVPAFHGVVTLAAFAVTSHESIDGRNRTAQSVGYAGNLRTIQCANGHQRKASGVPRASDFRRVVTEIYNQMEANVSEGEVR
jgi:hypothetical protein